MDYIKAFEICKEDETFTANKAIVFPVGKRKNTLLFLMFYLEGQGFLGNVYRNVKTNSFVLIYSGY